MTGQIERDRDRAHSRGGDGGRGALADARLAFVGAGVMAESMIAGLLGRDMIHLSGIVRAGTAPLRRVKADDSALNAA